jgi:regulator of protease activity HflC (stomatin/prohibitin superfamily)
LVFRFGALVREQGPGLLLAWPAPIERVELAPGPEQLLSHPVRPFDIGEIDDDAVLFNPRRSSAYLMTGDASIVRLQATLFFQVTDATAYALARDQLFPAIDRLFAASSMTVLGARDLDDVMVARPETAGAAVNGVNREQLRGAIVSELNRRLGELASNGAPLGVQIARVDFSVAVPKTVRPAFDAVLTAAQSAEQTIANARTAAARIVQDAEQQRTETIAQAHASAAERLANARSRTTTALALAAQARNEQRAPLLDRLFRERIATILKQAGSVTTVDGKTAPQLLLPGSVSGP